MTEETSETTEAVVVESGVAFADLSDAEVFVEGTFLRSGEQLQHLFIGLEPVLIVQPEYDADENSIKFIVTGVDLDPKGLIEVIDVIRDAAVEMVQQQKDMGLLDDDEDIVDAEVVSE